MKTYEEKPSGVRDEKPAEKKRDPFEEILRAALELSPGARAMMATHLLESLDAPNQKDIDASWAEEIERRIREIDEGKVELIPGDKVMAELRSRFKG
ncbi:MAG TPA: addiction module protein [Pyrinomonadaceae bacterium]|jgi:putative addiction module component, TIGR02574 family|nr:addiction module protein [Pyrinomonadaceae bacterium]